MSQYSAQWTSGIVVRWRALGLSEYRSFERSVAARDANSVRQIYQTCVINGPPSDSVPAGIAQYIAQHVMGENPFGGEYKAVKSMVDQARGRVASNFIIQAKAVLIRAFHCTLEEIDKWDADFFFDRLAIAELVTGIKIDPVNPKEAIEKADRPPSSVPRSMNPLQAKAASRTRERNRSTG